MRITSNLKHICRIVTATGIKYPKNCRNRSKESHLRATFYQKVEIFDIFGAAFPPPVGLRWNFAQPSGPRCPSALQSLTWIGATSRPCGAKKMIFGLWVNLIPAVCRLAAILPVITIRSICHIAAADFFAFWKISAENLRMLLRHPAMKLRNGVRWRDNKPQNSGPHFSSIFYQFQEGERRQLCINLDVVFTSC